MDKQHIYILNQTIRIPAILWGTPSTKLLIEVHGNCSNKEDTVISILARIAVAKGYQVLSFDLPMHGERTGDEYACIPEHCVSDPTAVYAYAKSLSSDISLFACSMGAYFSLLAYHDLDIKQSLFLSPVVNMKRIIQNMMTGFHVSAARLESEQQIQLPIGQTLDWDYYCQVKNNPICFGWTMPTTILYGLEDDLCEWNEISSFAARYQVPVTALEHGGHYFHTTAQLLAFEEWAANCLL